MKERPILFSAPMVRAILEGRKTQTRRIVRDEPVLDVGVNAIATYVTERDVRDRGRVIGRRQVTVESPYGYPGDRLWVKETIRHVSEEPHPVSDTLGRQVSVYAADDTLTKADAWPWQRPVLSSIHCPRGLSRIDLEVTSVRVERLRDISEADATAEGARRFDEIHDSHPYKQGNRWSMENPTDTDQCLGTAQLAFGSVWESINGPRSWEQNPWVWVIEFKRIEAKAEAA